MCTKGKCVSAQAFGYYGDTFVPGTWLHVTVIVTLKGDPAASVWSVPCPVTHVLVPKPQVQPVCPTVSR